MTLPPRDSSSILDSIHDLLVGALVRLDTRLVSQPAGICVGKVPQRTTRTTRGDATDML